MQRANFFFLLVLLTGLFLPTAFAQDLPADPEELEASLKAGIDTLIVRLELTSEQVDTVRTVLATQAATQLKFLALIEDASRIRTKRKLRGQMEEAREKTQSILGDLLTDEQMATYLAIQEENRKRIQEARKNRN